MLGEGEKVLSKRSTSSKVNNSIVEDHIVKNILAAKIDLEKKSLKIEYVEEGLNWVRAGGKRIIQLKKNIKFSKNKNKII